MVKDRRSRIVQKKSYFREAKHSSKLGFFLAFVKYLIRWCVLFNSKKSFSGKNQVISCLERIMWYLRLLFVIRFGQLRLIQSDCRILWSWVSYEKVNLYLIFPTWRYPSKEGIIWDYHFWLSVPKCGSCPIRLQYSLIIISSRN